MLIKKIRDTFSNKSLQRLIKSESEQRSKKIANGYAKPTLEECLIISEYATKKLEKLHKEAERELEETKALIQQLSARTRK